MITRPSIFDIKYQNMSQEETLLNYNRDMMLYEQTEALNKLTQFNNSQSSSDYTHILPYECMKPDNPDTYKLRNLNHKYDILDNSFTPILIVILFLTICLIPIIMFIIPNPQLLNVLLIILPVTLISLIITRIKATKVYNEIKRLLDKYKNREY